jgi:hypothetical protein
MASSRCLVLISRSALCCAGCEERPGILSPQSDGQHSSAITARRSRRWISLPRRGAYFNEEVVATIKSFGIEPKRTSFQSPWQNGVGARFVGSCRHDLLDHVIVLNECHLKRLMSEFIDYYHEDRMHIGLAKQTPSGRKTAIGKHICGKVVSLPKLGGCIIATTSLREVPWNTRAVSILERSLCPKFLRLQPTCALYVFPRVQSRSTPFASLSDQPIPGALPRLNS